MCLFLFEDFSNWFKLNFKLFKLANESFDKLMNHKL